MCVEQMLDYSFLNSRYLHFVSLAEGGATASSSNSSNLDRPGIIALTEFSDNRMF